VVVARVVVPVILALPDTVRAVVDAFPRDDDAEMRLVNVPVVNEGEAESDMVEVPEKMMLDPAFKYAIGELKKLFQRVDDAESGIAYPACVPAVKV
jgi:hypothetical protein